MKQSIAIVAVAFNRLYSLQRLLRSLEKAYFEGEQNVPLIISIDKSDTDDVERFADSYVWNYGEKRVIKHNKNIGLKAHVLGLGKWLDEFDAIVVLEDDVVVAEDFWYYVCQCVDVYESNEDIAGVSLYGFSINYHLRHPFIPLHVGGNDVYFMNCAMSWGQVWMRKSWKKFESWCQENQEFKSSLNLPESICSWGDRSWLKYHTKYCMEENKYFVFPYVSYSTNFSDAGVHISAADTIYQVPLLQGKNHNLCLPIEVLRGVAYDGFFENKELYRTLGCGEDDVCLDLNGANSNRMSKRFWLTTKKLSYHVKEHFSIALKPIEQNVLQWNHEGNGIYLYDTSVPMPSPKDEGNPAFLVQHYIQNGFLFLREYGFKNVLKDFLKVVKIKFGL